MKTDSELPAPTRIGSGAVLGFVMDRMPWDEEWTIRIVIPGLDGNGAIWLETEFQRETRDEAEQMLDDIVAALKNLKREKDATPRSLKIRTEPPANEDIRTSKDRSEVTASANAHWLRRLVRWLRLSTCHHEFRLGYQSLTGIQEPAMPSENASYAACLEWCQMRDKHPSHTKRVQWPCAKCGKVFYAHCGLDILSKNGSIQKPPNEKS